MIDQVIDILIQSKIRDLGGGFNVRRSLPSIERKMVGPFIFFDHMGPIDFEIGNGMDVRPHPHIGLSTLTYMFDGEAVHRDTLGFEQIIAPGDVNWMTAGSGVAHSERSPHAARASRQRLHGIQTWIALPKEKEEVVASFFHHDGKEIPEISEHGNVVRVIAGEFEKQKSPVCVHSPLTYLDVKSIEGATFECKRTQHELGVYCVSGMLSVGDKMVGEGALGIFHSDSVRIVAKEASRFLILGGEKFLEPRHIWWNFVSSSRARIEKAKIDWENRAFGKIEGDDEYMSLPKM